MTTTIVWDCRTVDVYPTDQTYTDVIYSVQWSAIGTSSELDPDGNAYSATSMSTQTLNTSNITEFTPIEDLTNAEVEAWTKSAMGTEQVSAVETGLYDQVALLISPTSITMQIGNVE
jgi:hypothetical protein